MIQAIAAQSHREACDPFCQSELKEQRADRQNRAYRDRIPEAMQECIRATSLLSGNKNTEVIRIREHT